MNRTFRSRLHGPAEGWLSLFLVAVLAVTVAWSLDDAGLVLGQRNLTHFLPWMAVAGVATGFLGARAGWNRPVAHLVGAAFAALIVPLVIGSRSDRFAGRSLSGNRRRIRQCRPRLRRPGSAGDP